MHQIHIFLKGLIIGLSIAVPVGPIGILCIRRTLVQGRINGVLSGLGAATADALYGAIAGFRIDLSFKFSDRAADRVSSDRRGIALYHRCEDILFQTSRTREPPSRGIAFGMPTCPHSF